MSVLSVLLLVVAAWAHVADAVAPLGSIQVTIDNFSGKSIHLYWISSTKDLVPQTSHPILNSSNTVINSYNTHRFLVLVNGEEREKGVSFMKGPYEETITVFTNKKGNLQLVQVSKFDEFEEQVTQATKDCGDPSKNKGYAKCLSRNLYRDIEKKEKLQKMVKHFRDENSNALRNYTCADPTLQSSEPLSHSPLRVQGKEYNVSTLLDMEAAKIWTVPDFITDSECQSLMDHGRKKLTRATVAGEDGLFTISQSRRAQQASYRFTDKEEEDPLWSLYNRIFEFTNKQTGYRMQLPGQEGFTIIQYNQDDEYQPHCDGACDGNVALNRGRIATAIVYCKVPEEGGGTTFTKANIFVKPKKGMATFFSYKGPDNHMDTGFTEHSGCPIVQGEKWIATVWMRQGVDHEHDWQNVDPAGERLVGVFLPEEEEEESRSARSNSREEL